MYLYITKRILIAIPTLLGIITINFFVIQLAPGGPIEHMMAKISQTGNHGNILNSSQDIIQNTSSYKGAKDLNEEILNDIKKMYGFDKPLMTRYIEMIKNYIVFDFGDSFFRDIKVTDLIVEKLPVSASLGIASSILVYIIALPLGILKATKHNSKFDTYSSIFIIILYSIPVFLLAIVLIIFFAGGEYYNFFPLRGIVSDNYHELTYIGKIKDYLWHLILPVFAISVSSLATLTMITKNSFLDEIHKQYVNTARSKGLSENSILYNHIFRNAMLIIIASIPAVIISAFFTGSLLIEIIFSLDGIGLLGYESVINRDYPVIFGVLYIFTLLSLIVGIINDIVYTIVDPRIDFENKE